MLKSRARAVLVGELARAVGDGRLATLSAGKVHLLLNVCMRAAPEGAAQPAKPLACVGVDSRTAKPPD